MSNLDVDKICRLCCENKNRMRSLFEQRQEYPLSLQQIISYVSRLEVEPDDGMPQKICKGCVSNLLKMHESIELFRKNDLMLRNQLADSLLNTEIKQEEEEVDIYLEEKVFTEELQVDHMGIKLEYIEEEHLDVQLEEKEVNGNQCASDISQQDDAKNADEETGISLGQYDNPLISLEDDGPVKKYRRAKQEKGVKGNRKPRNPLKKKEDRPRVKDYKCYICKSESLGTPEVLIAHLNRSHSDKVPYTCQECVKETVIIKSVEGVNAHIRQHLNPEKCPYCDKRLGGKRSLQQHVESFHQNSDANSSFSCKYCGKEFATKNSLIHHMKLHTTAVSCEICGKLFKERRKLQLHIQRKHEKVKKHECSVCQKKLASLDGLQLHVKRYHLNQEFKCSYCPKTYRSEASTRYHERKHMTNPEYVGKKDWTAYYSFVEGQDDTQSAKKKKCLLCGTVTTAMLFHLSSVHFPTEYTCSVCGETFKRKQIYENHVLEHEYGKAHQCPICERKFSLRKNLIAHLRTKKHQDHPLAQSLDWLRISATKSKPRKPKEAAVDEEIEASETNTNSV